MATVYLAEDVRHQRSVALKVLKPELAAVLGAERFLNEIRTTAGLQHPHILPLFDSGTADGFLFYVMPYVEGESLRARLDREKQLGVEEAVRIAQAVAAALDHAHGRGVIHRDIKPENILLHEGQALVADFGIALAVTQAGGERITETGLSIGTPHYMSPEQASADRVLDGRTDVYSLGAMTFEMLVGRPPFQASSSPALLSRILSQPAPRVRDERPAVPRNVDAAVHVALSKLPADRFPSAGRFAAALGDSTFVGPDDVADVPSRQRIVPRYAWPALVAASLALAWFGWSRPDDAPRVTRLHFALPEGQQLQIWPNRTKAFALSADGTKIVYQNQVGGVSELVLRDLAQFETRALPGTRGARHQFFSPDGAWVAFFADGALQRVPVGGGAPVRISPVQGASFGGSWGPDGRILYSIDGALYLVDADGSTPLRLPIDSALARLPHDAARGFSGDGPARWPHILPDGRHALATVRAGATIAIDLTTFDVTYVFPGLQARYIPTGHLVYDAGEGRLRAVPFDLDRLEVTGTEIPVVDDVFRGPGAGAAEYAVAEEAGTLVYAQGGFNRRLVFVDRNGRVEPVSVEPRGYRFPAVSPDGRWAAVTVDPRPSDLWIVDLLRGTAERQRTPSHDGWGVWSPTGDRIAFLWGENGAPMGWRQFPLVSAPVPIMRQGTVATYPSAWTHDDRLLCTTAEDVVAVSIRDGSVEPVMATGALERSAALSPDGRWMAFVSDVSGANEVYVVAYPHPAELHAVSTGGGLDPVWSRDGSEIFFRSGNAIMAAPVRTGTSFDVTGPATELFSGAFDFTQERNWDVMPDGRFLMIQGDLTTTTRLEVVLNWFEELKRKSGG